MSTRRLRIMRVLCIAGALSGLMVAAGDAPAQSLEEGFRQPPPATRPWCYWYWISDNISKEGITRDLEAMARGGIGEALIGNVFFKDTAAGDVKVLSEPWWDIVEHAIREGGRVGVDIGMFNCPGWSQSGGPWITPAHAMRYLVSSETRVAGPATIDQLLAAPSEPFQDVAVLAFPAPQSDSESLAAKTPQVTCVPAVAGLDRIVDGTRDTVCDAPAGAAQLTIDVTMSEPLTARHLTLVPGPLSWAAECELQAADRSGTFQSVRKFRFDRSNMEVNVGPMPRGPVTVALAPVTASQFRLVLTGISGTVSLAELDLSPAARLESFVEKQLGKMHPTPTPMWDTYLWPRQAELDQPALAVPPDQIIDLTHHLKPDGTLHWDVPAGQWVILRTGMTTTGTRNSPASPEATGLEVDKMNRQAASLHFDAFIGEILRRMPADERRALKHVVADSYEMGSQNWTDDLAPVFRDRYGYDPIPWLPVLTGRIVGSADQSDRFLWDLRRLVADRVATEYVGGLRDLCRANGLQLWLENYGHWGFPAEFLQYGGQADCLGGEFWLGGLGAIECRAATSAASIYGLPRVSAEAFTGGPLFQTMPSALKARGDWAFCEGINHFVLHVNIHQPWEDRLPGVNAWFGTEFNRHNTWFEASRDWIMYLRRCCFLLQQGTRVADYAYFIGEDAPKMTGARQPELPPGCDYDYINAEVIASRLEVKNGLLTLPDGPSYRVLVLPELSTMRPALLRKIRDLVAAGASVWGSPPVRSPSLEGYPNHDSEVRQLAQEIWGEQKGAVLLGGPPHAPRKQLPAEPDFQSGAPLLYTHRATGSEHIYFVSNQRPQEVVTTAVFRVADRVPELWWPASGRIEYPGVYDAGKDSVSVPLNLQPHESVFVVFRRAAPDANRIVRVQHNGNVILDAKSVPDTGLAATSESADGVHDNFTLALWAKPSADTELVAEAGTGAGGLGAARNDAIFPAHGSSFGAGKHAGSGLAIGRNGVCVFEHGATYFAPLLVHAMPLHDWTHVAIVYRDAQPSLYINGQLVHTGLRSTYTVHPSPAAGGGGRPFAGEMGAVEMIPRALDADQLATLIKSMVRPGVRPPGSAIGVLRDEEGRLQILARQAGRFALQSADGSQQTIEVNAVPKPLSVDGPWDVRFDPRWGGPERIVFETLDDWTQRPEAGIRHYSGTATYRTKFVMPRRQDGRRFWLDLGKVCDLAVVRLNGQPLGTLWMAPWRVEITDAVRSGENTLEVDVINAWNNRLVGDAKLPAEQRLTYLALPLPTGNSSLLPAGLLGPVRIESAVETRARE